MSLLGTLIIGFIIGVIAKFIVGGRDPGGCLITAVLGIVGSWVGQLMFNAIGLSRPVGFLGSVIGAVIVLILYHAVTREKT